MVALVNIALYALVVEPSGTVLIADTLNHRVVRWVPGARHGEVVAGGRGQGSRVEQLNKPVGLRKCAVTRANAAPNDVYI